MWANEPAQQITRRADALRIHNGRLVGIRSEDTTTLREAATALKADRAENPRCVSINGTASGQTYRLLLMTVGTSQTVPFGVSQPTFAILIIDQATVSRPHSSVLQEVFKLTPAEARIAGQLVQGYTVEEIAIQNTISLETARTHVRRLLAKTGVTRHGDLTALLLRGTTGQGFSYSALGSRAGLFRPLR